MPFDVMCGVGRGMGALDGGGDRRKGRDSLGVNLGRPVVTNDAALPKLLCAASVMYLL